MQWLADALTTSGYKVFIDKADIAAAELWRERIEALVVAADAVVFLMTPDAISSPVCQWEVQRTLSYGKKLVPLLWRRVDPAACPAELADRNWIDARRSWYGRRATGSILAQLRTALDTDVEWERERTVWLGLADRWAREDRAAGQLLRTDAIAKAESWAARRPATAAPLPDLLLAYLAASREREQQDRDRLRSITGRAFVNPIAEAIGQNEPDRALRMLATAAVLADDPTFDFVPQLWIEGARCLLQRPMCAVSAAGDIAAMPDGDTYVRHAVSASGARCAMVDADNVVRVSELVTGSLLWSAQLAITPRLLEIHESLGVLAADEDGTLVRLSIQTGEMVDRLELDMAIDHILLDRHTGTVLLAVDRRVFLYDPAARAVREVLTVDEPIVALAYCARTGLGVAVYNSQAELGVADTFGGSVRTRMIGSDEWYYAAISTDGAAICLAGTDEAAVFMHGETSPTAVVRHGDKATITGGTVNYVALNADGSWLLTASHDGTARIWDTQTGAEVRRFDHGTESLTLYAEFGPKDETVLTVGTDFTARLWSTSDARELARFNNSHNSEVLMPRVGVVAAGLGVDGRTVWTYIEEGLIQVWPVMPYVEWQLPGYAASSDRVVSMQIGADGNELVAVLVNGLVLRLDRSGGKVTHIADTRSPTALGVWLEQHAVIYLAMGSESLVLSADDGASQWRYRHDAAVRAADWSVNGDWAVVGGEFGFGSGFLDILGSTGDRRAHVELQNWGKSVRWHPGRNSLLVGDIEGRLYELNPAGHNSQPFIDFAGPVTSIAIPVTGTHFYVATERNLWRLDDGARQAILPRPVGADVLHLAVDAAEHMLYVEYIEESAFYDIATGALLLRLDLLNDVNEPRPETFDCRALSPDWGTFIGTTSRGRRLERALAGLHEIASSPATSIASALANGNNVPRLSETVDLLMADADLNRIEVLRKAGESRRDTRA
jgi:WD40 repeat protein